MKKINFVSLLLLLFNSLISFSQCETLIKTFKNELYGSKVLREYAASVDNPDNTFDAWRILFQEKSALRTDLKTIKEIENNLEAVKRAGGYSNWKKLANAGGKLVTKLDDLGLTTLIKKLDDLPSNLKTKFLDDFAEASDETLKALNKQSDLVDYWKTNRNLIKNRTYPNVGHKSWETVKRTITSNGKASEVKILNAMENARLPSKNEKVMAGAYCSDLKNPEVVIKYNTKNFDVTKLEPELQQKLDYLKMIKDDFDTGGSLYKKLYNNVPDNKMLTADKAGIHAEVLATNEVIKQLKLEGKFNGIQDLNKIEVLVKGKVSSRGIENMCRCPHCFHIIDGVKTIGNK